MCLSLMEEDLVAANLTHCRNRGGREWSLGVAYAQEAGPHCLSWMGGVGVEVLRVARLGQVWRIGEREVAQRLDRTCQAGLVLE